MFMTSEVLTALAGTLFPMIASAASTPNDSPFNSPDKEQAASGIINWPVEVFKSSPHKLEVPGSVPATTNLISLRTKAV